MNRDRNAERIVIMGAAGRDFRNFNVALRNEPAIQVVAFTAAQIPGAAATPIDLAALITLAKPVVRARYEYADAGAPALGGLLDEFVARRGLGGPPAAAP